MGNNRTSFPIEKIRQQFPVLDRTVHGRPLIYLDTAATSHKPKSVIDAITHFYSYEYATVNRGVYTLCQEATARYCSVRQKVAQFINAGFAEEIVFTRGTTDGINLVANSFIPEFLNKGDEVLIFASEHHSNIVPWQMAEKRFGIALKVLDLRPSGDIDLDVFKQQLSPKTRLVSFAHISNVTGAIHPAEEIVAICQSRGIYTLIDGAQSIAHVPIDVKSIGCDFFVFSSHKMYGPTGLGCLFGKMKFLEKMSPFQGGGDMIEEVSYNRTVFAKTPLKFEAGTPMIAQVIGLGAAIDFVLEIGIEVIRAHEENLMQELTARLMRQSEVLILGNPRERSSILSFAVKDWHSLDLATLLDLKGIAIRSGHMCAQPYLKSQGYDFVARVSFGIYNTLEEVELFANALKEIALV